MDDGRPPLERARRRALATFALALLAYLGIAVAARTSPLEPTANNHFAVQAAAWLDGRLALDGDPPGYCSPDRRAARECRHHRHDDWAVVWTLELDGGETVRGFPCRTRACVAQERRERRTTWRLLDGSRRVFAPSDIVRRRPTWYVSFPPGPAVVMTPLVAVLGDAVPDRLVSAALGALAVALFLWMLDTHRGVRREHAIAAVALALAGPLPTLAAHGSVWFVAQAMAVAALVAYLHFAWDGRRGVAAGVALALACSARPHVAPAALFFVAQWWRREDRSLGALASFIVPVVAVGLAMATLNALRFDDPFEFGHRFLDIRWQTRIQETGLFSLAYLRRNLECALWLLPVATSSTPFFALSIHGSAVWIASPWLGALAAARAEFPQRLGSIAAGVGVAIAPLLYQNSGQVQPTYRFAAEWLPFALLVIVGGGAARRRWFPALVAVGATISLVMAVLHAGDPARLYVTDPLGWPFESELR